MATVVIVHGAWGAGWHWRPVGLRLREAGHDVYRVTLTGMGERVHLATPEVNLDTHILDVVNTLEAEDLRDVVLVGHSYGGMPITGAADRVPERLSRLIYLDAFVPRDGECLLDLLAPEARRLTEEALTRSGDGWRIFPAVGFDLPRPWPAFTPRLAPQPWKTFTQPEALHSAAAAALPRTYVRCTADKAPGAFNEQTFALSWARAQEGGWHAIEFDGVHTDVAEQRGADLLIALLDGTR